MKLLRYRTKDEVKPGILHNNKIKDLSSVIEDISPKTLDDNILLKIQNLNFEKLKTIDNCLSIAPFINHVGKFICIGLNYSDHAKEVGMENPKEPIIFMKATSSICGPNDDIIIPKNSQKTDWEVELGIVIGKEAKYIETNQSQEYIAGYCLVNDISERDFQLERLGQWTKGKSCDSFGPIGPYLVTKEEIPDPQNLNMWCHVNNKKMQDGSTSTMIHKVNYVVSYLSQFMSLQPGDIISTGTPPGVGMGSKPPVYLKKGDTIKLGISGLGEQIHKVI